jgi:heme exporter protein C
MGRWLGVLALLGLALWVGLVISAPQERIQGIVQKILYVHVPCVPPAYLGFILTAIGGLGYLRTRQAAWDRLALAGATVGIVFCTLIVVTGPIWAKAVWGHWWVWDLRLTLTLVLWFLYVAYLFVRALAFGSDTARTFASVYGIAGTAVIPFVHYAVRLAGGSAMHPSNPASGGTLPTQMAHALLAGLGAFLLVFLYLLIRRFEVAGLESRLLDAGGSPEGH